MQIAFIRSDQIEQKPAVKKLTRKEIEYIDSLNWVNQQKALDRKEAKKHFAVERNMIETKNPRL